MKFLRIGQHHIINLDNVSAITRHDDGTLRVHYIGEADNCSFFEGQDAADLMSFVNYFAVSTADGEKMLAEWVRSSPDS